MTTSAAFQRNGELGAQALKRIGQSFSPDGRQVGITPVLASLLRQAGFEDVRLRSSVIEWSNGTPAHYGFFKDCLMAMTLGQPFLAKSLEAGRDAIGRVTGGQGRTKGHERSVGARLIVPVEGRRARPRRLRREEEV